MAKALVVDDSKAIRMILGRILEELGFEVREAADGRAAWAEMASLEDSDTGLRVAFLDWNMPEMNGFDLLKQIRGDPRFAALPVLMVTTEADLSYMTAALEAGANEYIMKPFTKDILVSKLELVGIEP